MTVAEGVGLLLSVKESHDGLLISLCQCDCVFEFHMLSFLATRALWFCDLSISHYVCHKTDK